MRKIVLMLCGVMAFAAFAGEYGWSGAGGLQWRESANWNPDTGFPNGSSDSAKFSVTPAGEVSVASGVTVKGISASDRAAVRIGGAGGVTLPQDAEVKVSGGADMSLGLTVNGSGRFDVVGDGSVTFASTVSDTTSGNYFCYFAARTNVFASGAQVSVPSAGVCFGLGAQTYVVETRIRSGASVSAKKIAFTGSQKCTETRVVQEGGTVAATSEFDLNASSTAARQFYTIEDGVLSVWTFNCATAAGGGVFTQNGGTVTTKKFNLLNGSYFLNGGRLSITGDGSGVGAAGSLQVADGATLELGATGEAHVLNGIRTEFGAGTVTVDVSGTVTVSGADTWLFADDVVLNLTASSGMATLILSSDIVLPDTVTIQDGLTLKIDSNTYITGRTNKPIALTVMGGGKLALTDQSSYLAHPLDLTIEDGAAVDMSENAGTALLAYSYVCAGERKNAGKNMRNGDRTHLLGNDKNAIIVPHGIWTGEAGDGKWETAGNWKGGELPTKLTSAPAVDFSQATGVVTIAGDIKPRAITYFPVEGNAKLRISAGTGTSKCTIYQDNPSAWTVTTLVGRGKTLEFDCDVEHSDNAEIFAGRGIVAFGRGVTLKSADNLCIDGDVVFDGTSSIARDLSAYRDQMSGVARVGFSANADVSVSGIVRFLRGGMQMLNGFWQEGGAVSANALYLTPYRAVPTDGGYYRLEAGTLTLRDGLFLGDDCDPTYANKRMPGGVFEMTGGTLVTPKFSTELNSNTCRLLGGEVRLGSGGFVKSAADGAHESYVRNTDPCFRFGAVKIVSTAAWSSSSELVFALEDSAETVFDTAGFAATVNGPVTGVGTFVKAGVGTLSVTGLYSATGDIRIDGGTLALASVPADMSIDTLSVVGTDSLSLPSGAEIKVAHLFVNGTRAAAGASYDFGAGKVTVAAPKTSYVWTGASGGNWLDAANWREGNVPNGADAIVDFSESALPAAGLVIRVNGAVALKTVRLDWGKLTLDAAGGILSFGDAADVHADDGVEIAIGAETHVASTLEKTGAGRVTFGGGLRSETTPASLAFGEGGVFRTAAGETVIACAVAGLHVYPLSTDASVVPCVRLAEGAVMTDVAMLTGVFMTGAGSGYGTVVMDAGTVDITAKTLAVFGSNGVRNNDGSYVQNRGKYCFAWFDGGSSAFTVNGGSFTVAAADEDGQDVRHFMNLNNTVDGGGTSTLVLNGGSMTFGSKGGFYFGVQNGCDELLRIDGGSLSMGGAFSRPNAKDRVEQCVLDFVTGSLTMTGNRKIGLVDGDAAAFSVKIGSNMTFAEMKDADILVFNTPVQGKACKVCNLGPGKLVFEDFSGLESGNSFDLDVRGGELDVPGEGVNFGRIDISGRGKVGLNYSGTKDLEVLYANGRQRGSGTYGSTARLASRFVGEGLLNVLTGENFGLSVSIK